MIYKSKRDLLIFLLPTVILLISLLYIPFLTNIVNSMYNMRSFTDASKEFIGLKNYRYLFEDPNMKIAVSNTFKMMGLTVVFQVGIALLLALLVNGIKKGAGFFRIVYFFPIVISATALGLMFTLFYNYNGGMLNQLMSIFGKESVFWLSKKTAFIMITIPVIWQYVGFYFVLLVTGISGVPMEVFESAQIDGANKFQEVIYITIPLIRNTINVCIILALTGALKVFDLPWVIVPKGAPGGSTHVLGTYMYDMTFEAGNIDYGATIAIVLVFLGIVISQVTNYFLKDRS